MFVTLFIRVVFGLEKNFKRIFMNTGLHTFSKAWEQYSRDFIPLQVTRKSAPSRFSNSQFNYIMDVSPVVTFIINHTSVSYEYLSENTFSVLGYSPKEFIKGGVAFGLSIIEPSHSDALHNFIIPTLFEYVKKFSERGELDKVNFSFNYKVKKKNGAIVWIHETMSVIEVNEKGGPVLSLFHLIDITNSKKDEKIDFCVNKRSKNGQHTLIHSSSYALTKTTTSFLTEREEDVLRLIGKGYSSKQIAVHLEISIHTVNTHRKNMLEKSKCKNCSELIILYNNRVLS
jgi:DNA-binding CsgD family transcriptional regulator